MIFFVFLTFILLALRPILLALRPIFVEYINMHAASGLCTHGVSNVGGVTASTARHNSSNVVGVTAGPVGHGPGET